MTDPQDPTKSFEVGEGSSMPVGPGLGSSFDSTVVDFGHYAGRRLEELAESDPGYLYWLARHPSGVRYRAEIARVLGARMEPTDY
jgi:Exodeoxyribonuclease X-like C-terminal